MDTAVPMGMGAPADPQLSSRLVQMPVELLERITFNLSTRDLARTRLTCKAVEQKLFKSFTHEFFRKCQFGLCDFSLRGLVDIAHHPTLGPELHHVIFDSGLVMQFMELSTAPELRTTRGMPTCGPVYRLLTDEFRSRLADIFRILPSLQTVEIRDFDSPTHFRDATTWCSHGARTLESVLDRDHANCPPNCPSHRHRSPNPSYASDVFAAVVRALAVSGARPRGIEMCLRNSFVQDTAFCIPPDAEMEMRELLAGLRTLHLAISSPTDPRYSREDDTRKNQSASVKKFLALANNLTWLRLNLSAMRTKGSFRHHGHFLEWLALTGPEPSPGNEALSDPPVVFSSLTRFDLGKITISSSCLSSILLKFAPSLRHLCLRSISLLFTSVQRGGREWNQWNPWTVLFKWAFSSREESARVDIDGAASPRERVRCGDLKLTALEVSGLRCKTVRLKKGPKAVVKFRAGTDKDLADGWSRKDITDYNCLIRDLAEASEIMWSIPGPSTQPLTSL